MRICQFCGTELPDQAGFCGRCGRTAGHAPEALTSGSGLSTKQFDNTIEGAPTISTPGWGEATPDTMNQRYSNSSPVTDMDTRTTLSSPHWGNAMQGNQPPFSSGRQAPPNYGYRTQLDNDEEDEEEKKRRAVLPGFGALGIAGAEQPPANNVLMVQGTPPFNGVPSVQGTPSMANSAPGGIYSAPTVQVPQVALSASPTMPPGHDLMSPPHHPYHPHHPHTPPHRPPRPSPGGCAPLWLILLFVAVLIITSILTITFTVLGPTITLSGSDVSIGGTIHLHGSGFIPGSSVTLTIDGGAPLYFLDSNSTLEASSGTDRMMAVGLTALSMEQSSSTSNIVTAGGDGTFNVTIKVDSSWRAGQHTIPATEKLSPRSAVTTITVHQPGDTPTPSPLASAAVTATASPTDTVTPSVTASPSVTVSPSTTPSGLSCINPGSVSLGPVSEGYSSAISTQTSLCTTGSGIVNWTASWDQNGAPWLKLEYSSGQIQAPGQQAITVSALATNLKPSTYTTTITFSSQQSSTTETLNVTFTVQTGCIHTSSQQLTFSGVEGVSDPQEQTLTATNCGVIGTWTTSTSTDNNVNWLSVAPTKGSLNSGATQNVTVTVSNLKTKLSAGTYSGKILFSIGSNQVVVYVTLTVQASPKIVLVVPSSGSFYANQDCSYNGSWYCIASISNSSTSQSVSWKASSTGVSNITFKPLSDTISPSSGERIAIIVPANDCKTPTTITFTGPTNVINISWSCTIPS